MPRLPKCEDLFAPTIELGQHEAKIVRTLAAAMRSDESTDAAIERLLKDPEIRREAEKYAKYGDLVFSRVDGPQIREKFNSQIVAARKKTNQDALSLDAERQQAEQDAALANQTLTEMEQQLRQSMMQYQNQIKEALAMSPPEYQQQRQANPFFSWIGKLYRSVINGYYRLRGFNPVTAQEELGYLLKDMGNNRPSGKKI